MGGDAFAQIWSGGRLYGLNSSGPAPRPSPTPPSCAKSSAPCPAEGWYAVNVPGIPAAWAEASRRFGRLPFAELLTHAINYAEGGYPVAPVVSQLWASDFRRFSQYKYEEIFSPWFGAFTVKGHAPAAGEVIRLPELAESLRSIAATGAESFYRGELARKIDGWSRRHGRLAPL